MAKQVISCETEVNPAVKSIALLGGQHGVAAKEGPFGWVRGLVYPNMFVLKVGVNVFEEELAVVERSGGRRVIIANGPGGKVRCRASPVHVVMLIGMTRVSSANTFPL